MQEIGNWIKNADAKVTILAAALGVVISVLAARSQAVASELREWDSWWDGILLALLCALAFTIVLTGLHLFRALRPSVSPPEAFNRFAWTSLAAVEGADPSSDPADIRREAWAQCAQLARIAARKYEQFAVALRLFIVVVSLSVALAVISVSLAAAEDSRPHPKVPWDREPPRVHMFDRSN